MRYFAQAIISQKGPASACFDFVRSGDIRLYWSDYVLQEIRELPGKLPPRLLVTAERVDAFLFSLAPFIEHIAAVPHVYQNPFDPDDSHHIDLAIAAGATLIVSRDTDLLRLMDETLPHGRAFRQLYRQLEIFAPESLITHLRNRPST